MYIASAARLAHISHSRLGRLVTLHQEVFLCPEVGVTGHHILTIEERTSLANEIGRVPVRSLPGGIGIERKLGHPELSDVVLLGQVHGLLDEFDEVVEIVTVPVHRQRLDTAVGAAAQEVAEPVESLALLVRVGHARRHQLDAALVGGQEFLEQADRVRRGQRRLVVDVGFVERHHVLDVVAAQERFDTGQELRDGLGSPQHGHELDSVGQRAVGRGGPVVGPADTAAARVQRFHGASVVVGSALLFHGAATTASMVVEVGVAVMGLGQGCRSHQGRGEEHFERNHVD